PWPVAGAGSQLNVNGGTPPETAIVALASHAPKQLAAITVAAASIGSGAITSTCSIATQPEALVTEAKYDPSHNMLTLGSLMPRSVPEPSLHAIVHGGSLHTRSIAAVPS